MRVREWGRGWRKGERDRERNKERKDKIKLEDQIRKCIIKLKETRERGNRKNEVEKVTKEIIQECFLELMDRAFIM